jgi:hypothetical protein
MLPPRAACPENVARAQNKNRYTPGQSGAPTTNASKKAGKELKKTETKKKAARRKNAKGSY